MSTEAFPSRLKTARELRELSQSALAERAGLPSTSISHFESGTRKPSFDNLRLLADALQVTADYLLGRIAEPTGTGTGDALARHAANLTAENRDFVEQMVKVLSDQNRKKK
jgi:transcriptional regulator with XRE-family HTH domain